MSQNPVGPPENSAQQPGTPPPPAAPPTAPPMPGAPPQGFPPPGQGYDSAPYGSAPPQPGQPPAGGEYASGPGYGTGQQPHGDPNAGQQFASAPAYGSEQPGYGSAPQQGYGTGQQAYGQQGYASGPQQTGTGYGYGQAADQPKAIDTKALKLISIIAGAVILLVVASAITITQVNKRVYSPEGTVASYFSALADGDAEKALEMADVDVPDEERTLLTNDVLSNAEALPESIETTESARYGDTAVVDVSYDLAGAKHSLPIEVRKSGRKALIFDNWEIVSPAVGTLDVSTTNLTTVAVNGVPVELDSDGLYLPAFPALYSVGPVEESEFYTAEPVTARTAFVGTEGGEADNPSLEAEATPALEEGLKQAVKDKLDDCAANGGSDDGTCPIGEQYYSDSRDETWSITTYPTVVLSGPSYASDGQAGPGWNFTTDSSGTALVTGERKILFGDWTEYDASPSIWVSGYVEVVDGELSVTFD